MENFFGIKTFLRLFAAAIVLTAILVLVSERIENTRSHAVTAEREVTSVVERTVIVTRIVERLVTQVPTENLQTAPSPTKVKPAVTLPTSTPEILAVHPQGVTAWCLPQQSDPAASVEIPVTGIPPGNAAFASNQEGLLTVITEVESCTFIVAFNKTLPDGVRFQVQDLSPEPFVDETLAPVQGDPALGFVSLSHHFIVDPPYWEVSYMVSVVSPDGVVLWQNPVLFKRGWQPIPCSNGLYPDPVTMECPLETQE